MPGPFPSGAGHIIALMLKKKRLYSFVKLLLLPSSTWERRKVEAHEENWLTSFNVGLTGTSASLVGPISHG